MTVAGSHKGLLAGLLVGVAATLLISHFANANEGAPERLAETLGCSDGSDGIHPSTAAQAHHALDGPYGYSWFAATHAERVIGVNGCDPLSPATTYLEFAETIEMSHVLATLDNFGAVCVVGQAVFDGRLLNGREHLEELCREAEGDIKTLHKVGPKPRFRCLDCPASSRRGSWRRRTGE